MHKLTPEDEISLIPEIMARYALPAPKEIIPVTEGISNHNYVVTTDDGGYFVKFVRKQAREQIENDVAIQRQLHRGGVRTPLYLRDPSGAYIFRAGGAAVVVSERIAGHNPRRMSPDLAFSMGRTLAKFHALVKTLPHPQACWMDPSTAVTAADDADVQALLSANLPSGITHGDLHPGNVHVVPGTPDDVHAIMDFEDGGVGLFMADLARSIIDTCIVTDGKRIDPELVRSEVAGYETLRRMTADERALLPSAVTYVTDACIRWFREFGFEAYIPDHRARAATFVSPF